MAITIGQRQTVNYNAPGSDGKPESDVYLDFIDDDGGNTVASLYVPASGATPTFTVDGEELGSGGVQTVYQTTVTLTNAQIKALPTTAIDLVAAPGAGLVIFPQSLVLSMHSSAAYTNVGANCGMFVRLGTVAFAHRTAAADKTNISNVFTSGDDEMWFVPTLADNLSQATPSEYENQTCNIILDQVEGAFTGGNAANELTVTLAYTISNV